MTVKLAPGKGIVEFRSGEKFYSTLSRDKERPGGLLLRIESGWWYSYDEAGRLGQTGVLIHKDGREEPTYGAPGDRRDIVRFSPASWEEAKKILGPDFRTEVTP